MCRQNNITFYIVIISSLFCSCVSSRIPFKFERDISSSFLKTTLEILKTSEDSEGNDPRTWTPLPDDLSGLAYIYHTKFIEGWMEQDNFVDLAVLNKDRENEFVSYNAGSKHIYNSYLILFKFNKSTRRTPFLFFTVQSLAGTNTSVIGFSKIYAGDLALNTRTDLLSATRIFSLKQKEDNFYVKETGKTAIKFILDREPYLTAFDSVLITKVVLSYDNELSGNKTMEIPVDKVMGRPASLVLRSFIKGSNGNNMPIMPIKIN